jgi:hypothetical protein
MNVVVQGFGGGGTSSNPDIEKWGEIQDFVTDSLKNTYGQLITAKASGMDRLKQYSDNLFYLESFTLFNIPMMKYIMFTDEFYKNMATAEYIVRASTTLSIWVDASIVAIDMLKHIAPLALAFGLFMRAFKYTRGFGGFLIALSISIYYVYPIVFYALFNDFSAPGMSSQQVRLNGCGYNVIMITNPVTISGGESSGVLFKPTSVDSKSIVSFVNSVYLNIFLAHSIALAATLTFLYHATLILGAGMLINEFESKIMKVI